MPVTAGVFALEENSAYPAVPATDIVSADHNAVLLDVQDSINDLVGGILDGTYPHSKVKAQGSGSTSSTTVVDIKNASNTQLVKTTNDGATFINGPVVIAPESEWGGSSPVGTTRHLYVAKQDTVLTSDAMTGHAAIEARMDYRGASTNSANPDGIYGTLWFNSATSHQGTGAAVRGNTYTIAQPGGAAVNVSNLIGLYGRPRHDAAGTVDNATALYADAAINGGSGTIVNAYSVLCAPQAAATNNYGVFFTNTPNNGSISASANTDILIQAWGSANIKLAGATGYVNITSNGAVRFSGYGAGTLTTDASGNVINPSDETLKDVKGNFTKGLSAILKIVPKAYQWKEETGYDRTRDYVGVIAQELQQIIPEAIGERPDGKLTLDERPILMALINAVKELSAEVQALKAV